jgi:hypothetical protein
VTPAAGNLQVAPSRTLSPSSVKLNKATVWGSSPRRRATSIPGHTASSVRDTRTGTGRVPPQLDWLALLGTCARPTFLLIERL